MALRTPPSGWNRWIPHAIVLDKQLLFNCVGERRSELWVIQTTVNSYSNYTFKRHFLHFTILKCPITWKHGNEIKIDMSHTAFVIRTISIPTVGSRAFVALHVASSRRVHELRDTLVPARIALTCHSRERFRDIISKKYNLVFIFVVVIFIFC